MSIIIKPIVSEKLTAQGEKLNRYGFVVGLEANKIQIKSAIEKYYGVTVEAVNTVRYAGKVKSRNTKRGLAVGRTNSYKKAYITLKAGETIDFFSNI
jgi:large subunit ribosomal protein L23